MTASTFPTTIDTFTTKVDGTTTEMADHINYPQSCIAALETKVGVDNSAVQTTLDYLIKGATDPGHSHTRLNFSSTPPAHNTSAGTTGEVAMDNNWLYICRSSGNWVRIALNTTAF